MAGQLSAFGYSLSDNPDEADLWLINTYVLLFLIVVTFIIFERFSLVMLIQKICEVISFLDGICR